jgi:hypothetical protein
MDISDRFAETLPCGCEYHAGQWFPCATHFPDTPFSPHSVHTRPVVGCLDCEDELYDARCLEAQEPWND